MWKAYVRERRSWLLFFTGLQLLLLLVAYLDATIPVAFMLYVVFLSTIMFAVFVFIRYHKETRFYQTLSYWDHDLDVSTIDCANRPFEKLVFHKINAQTASLREKALHSEQTLASEKDDLIAWVHEMKTPLTAMHLMIERLEDPDTKAQFTYEWIRVHSLLDQQLHQKRLPFIQNDLYMETVDIAVVVHREIRAFQSWCMQKGIGFDMNWQVTEVVTDAKWLAFIVRQVLSNAIKYSPASEIFIKSYDDEGQTVIEVKDAGRGIAEKYLPRLFDKGFTGSHRHDAHVATGMGLYLAKKAAESLLIEINVQSTVGIGTTVQLRFSKRNAFIDTLGM